MTKQIQELGEQNIVIFLRFLNAHQPQWFSLDNFCHDGKNYVCRERLEGEHKTNSKSLLDVHSLAITVPVTVNRIKLAIPHLITSAVSSRLQSAVWKPIWYAIKVVWCDTSPTWTTTVDDTQRNWWIGILSIMLEKMHEITVNTPIQVTVSSVIDN